MPLGRDARRPPVVPRAETARDDPRTATVPRRPTFSHSDQESCLRQRAAALGLEPVLLTGDNRAVAEQIAAEVGEVVFEGDRFVYEVTAPVLGGASLRLFDLDPLEHPRHRAGETVTVGWKHRDLMLFPE